MVKVALYGQKLDKENLIYLKIFISYAKSHSIEVYIEEHFFSLLEPFKEFDTLPFFNFSDNTYLEFGFKFIFSFGGDGTILSLVPLIKNIKIPIIGVNTGRLGFLATFNKHVFLKKLDEIFQDKFTYSKRRLLEVQTHKKKENHFNFALNEIAILRKETVSMIKIDAYIENEFLTSYWADGLIISTPTGSTGYSLSCGGPIISPECKNFALTPISPHNLFSRPLIIPDRKKIHLRITSTAKFYSLSLDNRLRFLETSHDIYIKRSKFFIYILQEEESYFKALREKLLWGLDKRN